ncbi:uncharacterized protein LOC123683919 [Harmonia axyridis]|uniref:uncharacterized protein LOC123683919 n=1 Tax=Harmonia axyridis TaxID=115357 RepID=UPI001E279890|nr:uncharacterized protein LOC123683919 [Harmonia axyridis]
MNVNKKYLNHQSPMKSNFPQKSLMFASEEYLSHSSKELTPQEVLLNRVPGWIGDHLIKLESLRKGLWYYKEALYKNPKDTSLLYKRSDAYGKSFEMQRALADIQRIAKIEPMKLNAVARKTKFLFYNGEFEKCMVTCFNHMEIRKKPPYFTLGLLLAKNAIENCLGKRAGHPLRDYYEIIREKAWQDNVIGKTSPSKQRRKKKKTKTVVLATETHVLGSVKPLKPVRPLNIVLEEDDEDEDSVELQVASSRNASKRKTVFSEKMTKVQQIPRVTRVKANLMDKTSVDSSTISLSNISLDTSFTTGSLTGDKFSTVKVPKSHAYPYRPLQKRTSNIDNYLACSYLGRLFCEKRFLTDMSNNPGYIGKNEEGNQILVGVTKEGTNVLEYLQEILRTRMPFYNIKYQEFLNRSRKVEMDKAMLMERDKINAINKLNMFFADIAKCIKRMDVQLMNKTADTMYRFCKSTDKAIIPDKDSILYRLYKLLGDGTLFSYRFLPGMSDQQMITRVNLALALPFERRNSQESFYRRFKGREQNWLDRINTFEQRVRICKYSEEVIWLYHELSKFNVELKRYTLAKTYCGRCIHEARKCEDFKWAVNGYMMMTRIAVFQKNKNDVRRNLRLAISTAKNLNIKELDVFLQTCYGVVSEWKFEKANNEQIFLNREQGIIKILPTYHQKRTATLIFGQMHAKALDRRLAIMPGFADTEYYDVIETKKEEMKKKKPVKRLRGLEAEMLLSGNFGRSKNIEMNI